MIKRITPVAIALSVIGIAAPVLLLSCAGALASAAPTGQTSAPANTAFHATPTYCPRATPEPLWVDPVVSPTDLLTQIITVSIGHGEAVTVSLESGVYAQTGAFNAYGNPAAIQVDLLPDTTHHLEVSARVERVDVGGCPYGGYTLRTQVDREGNPLTIVQEGDGAGFFYLPIVLARGLSAADSAGLPGPDMPNATRDPPSAGPIAGKGVATSLR